MKPGVKVGAVVVLAVVCGLAGTAAAQDPAPAKRGPSTPAERARFVQVVHKLEANPLDTGLKPDIRWAMEWINVVPDIDVSACMAPLGGFVASDHKYKAVLFTEYVLAMGAFIIEHPEQAKDGAAVNLGGVQSLLTTYRAILRDHPQATSKELDELAQKQSQGTLADSVREASKQCK